MKGSFVRKYRGRLEIVHDILSAINEGTKKTHIMYKANLSFKLLNRYLEDVLMADLVVFQEEGSLYCLTESGEEFLSRCKSYFSLREQVESAMGEMSDREMALEKMLSENNKRDS